MEGQLWSGGVRRGPGREHECRVMAGGVPRIHCPLLFSPLPSPVLPSIPLQDGEAPGSPEPPARTPDREAAPSSSADERFAPKASTAGLPAAASPGRHDPAAHASLGTRATAACAASAAAGPWCPPACSSAAHDEASSPHGGARHHSPASPLQLKPPPDCSRWTPLARIFLYPIAVVQRVFLDLYAEDLTRSCRFSKRFPCSFLHVSLWFWLKSLPLVRLLQPLDV